MLISEIFHSLQGEGELTGVPSIFVRTSGCNLRCSWCDTPYASWNPEGTQMEVAAIVDEVIRHPARHVVLTGGEPMLAPGIGDLAGKLKALGYHITIETAGTLAPAGIACDLASLSPKLAHSAPDPAVNPAWHRRHEESRWQPEILRAWLTAYPYQLKFVVSRQADVEELEALVAELRCDIPRHRILLMPEGTTQGALAERAGWLAEVCRQRGYRFAQRLHIQLYGNTRGT